MSTLNLALSSLIERLITFLKVFYGGFLLTAKFVMGIGVLIYALWSKLHQVRESKGVRELNSIFYRFPFPPIDA